MSEPQFFPSAGTMTAAEIAGLVGAEAREGDPLDRSAGTVAALDVAGPRDLSFLDDRRMAEAAGATRAGICLVSPRYAAALPAGTTALIVKAPYHAFVTVAARLYQGSMQPGSLYRGDQVAANASVHPAARLEADVRIDPGAVIGAGAEIGSGTLIGAGAVIGAEVRIGRGCAIGPGATIMHALIGDGVVIHPGCRIGQDGFGYISGRGGHEKVPQIGRVIIQDRVEIGANSTIDRGGLRDTVIGEGTKIDNLVQIGHNVSIGRHCMIVALCGISGSVTLEDYVVLGGQVGIAGHLTIGEGAQLGAQSGVMTDVPAGERWVGAPAMPARAFFRIVAERGGMPRKRGNAGTAADTAEERGGP